MTIATSQSTDQLGNPDALTDGYSAAFPGATGIAVIDALLAAPEEERDRVAA
jgi:hypothetical protein